MKSTVIRDRRGAIALLVALLCPALVGGMALAVSVGFFYVEQQRLQVAADAAAIGAAMLLPNAPTSAQLQAAATQAVSDVVGSTMIGQLATPVSVSSTSSSVTVSLTSQANGFMAFAQQVAAPTLKASATAGVKQSACVLALINTSAIGIQVDNMGSITASNCGIFSDSPASNSIYLNSGTISGTSVGASGQVLLSNSGSNTLSPNPAVSGGTPKADPYAGDTAPTPGSCSYTNASFTAYQSTPYHFTQSANVFCGDTTIGGNSTTDTFDPGIYYVVNGSLTFNNAALTNVTGITFVLTGSAPGGFNWTNYSNTTTQLTAGASGFLVWQTCGSTGRPGTSVFNGGSTMEISGAVYMPCGTLELSNDAHLATVPGSSMTVVADTIYVTGSAGIAAAQTSTSNTSNVVLQQ